MIPLLLIALSASLWGLIAIFVRTLSKVGFTPMEIVTIRVATATVMLCFGGLFMYPKQMKIKFADVKLFVGTGICSIVFFNWCYFTTINHMNLSIAVILLYTAPAFVTVLSFFFLNERLNVIKIISVIGTLIGCIFIAGINLSETSSISTIGLITGLGAGFGYSLYSIFGKFALRKYESFTVTFYTFLIATITLIPLTGIWEKWSLIWRSDNLFWALGLGLFPTVIAYFMYTKGLEKMESSKASIIATVEPVVATLLSVIYYQEKLGVMQLIGAAFVLISVILVNLPKVALSLFNKTKAPIN
ncbi:EamA family transporter [Neobacillus sp. PS3-40]|uniref:DMT family transporter n=1 Tax=Neobacillus sp. PS3-40 TaxID=3070679 RepID=UPI0027DF7906|nr:EamA family transporter [Neobacillus sp. PS3-40]WML46392.1 EamA family transporter [Neobacillus sp. PS3-40]